jgi:hypothetical protein
MSADPLPACFVDTNVLVYAVAGDDAKRSPVAQKLVRELMTMQVFRTSIQVLQELFVTLTRKVRTPLTAEQAARYLDQIAVWPVIVLGWAYHCGGRAVGSHASLYGRFAGRAGDSWSRDRESVWQWKVARMITVLIWLAA